jgi:beta-glucanase (GH16 family)
MKRKAILVMLGMLVLSACGIRLEAPTPTATAIIPTNTPTVAPSPTYGWNSQGWNLVWSDEFNGSTIDPGNWTYDLGGNGWGNSEFETYTNRPENARVENGMLIIEAHQDQNASYGFTSARLKTQGLQQFLYGRVEARMKLPYGQGIWPAFWMLGNNGGWPQSGEMDIMEYIGKTPDTIYQTVHGPGYSGAKGIGTHYVLSTDSLKNDFHVYALEWQPNEIRWYVDDQQVFEVTPTQIPAGTQWVFDHPFFIILNLAVGGGWPGYPDATTIFPQQLQVDYVRVYQQAGQTTPTP